MLRTRLCCALVPAFCLPFVSITSTSAAESPTEALDRLEKKNASVNSVYMQSRTVIEEDKNKRQSTLKVWRKKAGDKWKYRMLTTTEGDGKEKARPAVTASDGQSEWREVLAGDQTMVFKSKAANNGNQDLADVRARVKSGDAKIKGKERVEGQECTVIEINGNDNGNRSEISYWISDEHGLILRSRITRSDRNKTETVVTELKVNEPISDSDLNYTPPAGTAVIDTDNMQSPEKKPANKP